MRNCCTSGGVCKVWMRAAKQQQERIAMLRLADTLVSVDPHVTMRRFAARFTPTVVEAWMTDRRKWR
jgi:hypothetical protein